MIALAGSTAVRGADSQRFQRVAFGTVTYYAERNR